MSGKVKLDVSVPHGCHCKAAWTEGRWGWQLGSGFAAGGDSWQGAPVFFLLSRDHCSNLLQGRSYCSIGTLVLLKFPLSFTGAQYTETQVIRFHEMASEVKLALLSAIKGGIVTMDAPLYDPKQVYNLHQTCCFLTKLLSS